MRNTNATLLTPHRFTPPKQPSITQRLSDYLAQRKAARRDQVIHSLKVQLAAARAEVASRTDAYLALVDEHTDLREQYERLAYERLSAWGLERDTDNAAAPKRLAAPTAGDRT